MKPLILNVDGFPREFDFRNDQFPPLDALTYWHFLKKARRVVEVGCGYSTLLPHKAGVQITAIDPEPRVMYPEVPYMTKPVQHTDLTVFKELQENDILFVDSSHIYAEGSDVEHIIKVVIPNLNQGVLIHFHDYFGESGYPSDWQSHPEMSRWNENAYVLPLTTIFHVLTDNFKISSHYNEQLKLAYPFVPKDISTNLGAVRGASLWLKN
jgi:SAM-dependent methyltransferase